MVWPGALETCGVESEYQIPGIYLEVDRGMAVVV